MRVSFDHAAAREADLGIGADGLHSRVRQLVFGPQAQFHLAVWRELPAIVTRLLQLPFVLTHRPGDNLILVDTQRRRSTMATPKPVSRKLREMLGTEAAATMVAWLDGLEDRQDTLRREMRADIAELRQEMVALRQELRQEMAALRQELAALRAELRREMVERNSDLIKWMMGFWLTSFAGIVATIIAFGRH